MTFSGLKTLISFNSHINCAEIDEHIELVFDMVMNIQSCNLTANFGLCHLLAVCSRPTVDIIDDKLYSTSFVAISLLFQRRISAAPFCQMSLECSFIILKATFLCLLELNIKLCICRVPVGMCVHNLLKIIT